MQTVAEFRKELRAAMKWWRGQNPQYTDATVRRSRWHGLAVFATVRYETCCVATVSDVMNAYRAANAASK